MSKELARVVVEPDAVGFLVTGDSCTRCGDTNYDEKTLVCLTCTYPDDIHSRAYLEPALWLRARLDSGEGDAAARCSWAQRLDAIQAMDGLITKAPQVEAPSA